MHGISLSYDDKQPLKEDLLFDCQITQPMPICKMREPLRISRSFSLVDKQHRQLRIKLLIKELLVQLPYHDKLQKVITQFHNYQNTYDMKQDLDEVIRELSSKLELTFYLREYQKKIDLIYYFVEACIMEEKDYLNSQITNDLQLLIEQSFGPKFTKIAKNLTSVNLKLIQQKCYLRLIPQLSNAQIKQQQQRQIKQSKERFIEIIDYVISEQVNQELTRMQSSVICRICERNVISLHITHHLNVCLRIAEMKKELYKIEPQLRELNEKANSLYQQTMTQISLFSLQRNKKKLNHLGMSATPGKAGHGKISWRDSFSFRGDDTQSVMSDDSSLIDPQSFPSHRMIQSQSPQAQNSLSVSQRQQKQTLGKSRFFRVQESEEDFDEIITQQLVESQAKNPIFTIQEKSDGHGSNDYNDLSIPKKHTSNSNNATPLGSPNKKNLIIKVHGLKYHETSRTPSARLGSQDLSQSLRAIKSEASSNYEDSLNNLRKLKSSANALCQVTKYIDDLTRSYAEEQLQADKNAQNQIGLCENMNELSQQIINDTLLLISKRVTIQTQLRKYQKMDQDLPVQAQNEKSQQEMFFRNQQISSSFRVQKPQNKFHKQESVKGKSIIQMIRDKQNKKNQLANGVENLESSLGAFQSMTFIVNTLESVKSNPLLQLSNQEEEFKCSTTDRLQRSLNPRVEIESSSSNSSQSSAPPPPSLGSFKSIEQLIIAQDVITETSIVQNNEDEEIINRKRTHTCSPLGGQRDMPIEKDILNTSHKKTENWQLDMFNLASSLEGQNYDNFYKVFYSGARKNRRKRTVQNQVEHQVEIGDKNMLDQQSDRQELDKSETESDDLDDFLQGYFSDGAIKNQKYKIKKSIMNIGLKDFEFISVLGVGAFGAVWLVKKIKTNDYYAMKVIDCNLAKLEGNYINSLKAEKNVFELLEGDFVVKAFYSFISENYLFFLLEYMKGGDFGQVLHNYCALDESVVKFYVAEIVLSVESLHNKNIIHRDLKPQNILLDSKGHVKLADFGLSEVGLAKKIQRKDKLLEEDIYHQEKKINLPDMARKNSTQSKPKIAFHLKQLVSRNGSIVQAKSYENSVNKKSSGIKKHRIVGTPDYIPPEVISGQSISNKTIDWWSLGVILYEFLVGVPPFNDSSIEGIFRNIQNLKIDWPEIGQEDNQMSSVAQDLIKRFIEPDYHKRLGSQGVKEIKNHPFFQGIDWRNIRNQDAPIIPMQLGSEDEEVMCKQKKIIEQKRMEELLSRLKERPFVVDDPINTKIADLGVDDLMRTDLLAQLTRVEADNLMSDKKRQLCETDKNLKRLCQKKRFLQSKLKPY